MLDVVIEVIDHHLVQTLLLLTTWDHQVLPRLAGRQGRLRCVLPTYSHRGERLQVDPGPRVARAG